MSTIKGKYVLSSNPCMSLPCLPGMVYAVLTDEGYYYLTEGGSWLWVDEEQKVWNGYSPKNGDHVIVVGDISSKRDIKGNTFYEIEVTSLKKT